LFFRYGGYIIIANLQRFARDDLAPFSFFLKKAAPADADRRLT